MYIAQITDLHIEPAEALSGRFDTQASLRAVIEALNRLSPQPDLVLATGDLVNTGSAREYGALRDIVAALNAPLALLPGNHDAQTELRAAFPDHDYLPRKSERLCYTLSAGPLRILALDTCVAGLVGGTLGPEQLAWADRELDAAPGQATIVALHHPPFLTGIPAFDAIGLTDGSVLRSLLARHRQVVSVISGHVHRALSASFGPAVATTSASTCYAFTTFPLGETLGRRLETPGFALHLWTPENRLTTQNVALPVRNGSDFATMLSSDPRAEPGPGGDR